MQAANEVTFYLVLPKAYDPPACAAKTAEVLLVPSSIRFNFVPPKRLNLVPPSGIVVAVPKIPVDKDGELFGRENQVRTARESSYVPAEAITS